MPVISGNDYIKRMNRLKTNIWCDGERILGNIAEHPAFKGAVHSQAALYDMQKEPDLTDTMTYSSPITGDRVGTSYLQPTTKSDLEKRRISIQKWAKRNAGMLGRSPDYMNTMLMSFASSAKLLEGRENCFPDNLVKFYETAREDDLSFTHTFINPQVNRSPLYFEESEEPIAAKIVGEENDGLVIKGARLLATQGGMTDELLVLSAGGITDEANSFAFSVPSDTAGLKFICRESFVYGDSRFDYPLSSRFEEMDSIVVFDRVKVPWERIFFFKNLEVSNNFQRESAFLPFTLHQIISRQTIKAGFILGVAEELVQTINIDCYEHIQEKMAEIIMMLETMEALLLKSEINASTDEFGLMRPELIPLRVANSMFSKMYPRLIEIIQLLGSSGMVTIPTEADFKSPVREDLEQYLQSSKHAADDRVKLFRLAWDLTMSGFGTRQTQYERFFFGQPNKLSSELYKSYDLTAFTAYTREFW
ncbi:4-hydroxyphenylacetate 3-monooxygenase, oxygenase component [Virgibacillus sp. C22-A2]|uniref:4-hydroxyphenylacetate 3-monooxygenase, oxygenase component n=1 Tax=Virgibacillus tibetensis TaxID=3042313 RepID=A0ABU6KCY9_9BACI|nr:4-hydroxyphenylacetate 3-monooxygenase, oxygenase component [Virgibacillus sp. C22-A2]